MSLLYIERDQRLNDIAKLIFDRQIQHDKKLNMEYDERRKRLMYEDILYNFQYLNVAIKFDDNLLFSNYAVWIFRLLCSLMPDLTINRIKEQMINHYEILTEVLKNELGEDDYKKAHKIINKAIDVTEKEAKNYKPSGRLLTQKHIDIKERYLELLFNNDSKNAVSLIEEIAKDGIPIEEIYQDILQEVMYEVGNLWHQNKITIDKEHYFTSVTQVAMSQFYPMIFSKKRNGKKVISCCVGSELHEMGIRMVSDIFEYRGWNTIYLGAAVPNKAIINAINEHKPDLVALSVTMPEHLTLCYELVNEIRKKHKDINIAVGGRAFKLTENIWEKWDVDTYQPNAETLVSWAEKTIL